MAYSLFWRDPSLPYSQKQAPITVPSGSVVSNASSLRFTGKGAANYGKIQQENQMRLLENFAGPTVPDYPTVGQTWYDTSEGILKVCISTPPIPTPDNEPSAWRSLNGVQVTDIGEPSPTPAVLGDQWFQRDGSASGFQYVYTGLGRYPQVDWDENDFNYYPSTSTSLFAKLNYTDWSNQNYSELYICGFSSGVPADVDGTILINGVTTVVPRGQLATSHPVTNGFIVWDRTVPQTLVFGPNTFFSVRQLTDGTFQYDNNGTWISFTPVTGMYVIGLLTVAEQDDQTSPGITSATMWSEARDLKSINQVPLTKTAGAIGGWDQVYPETIFAAGREEYDYMVNLLGQLIGDTFGFGGCGAFGRSISYLTEFNTLDASLRSKWASTLPQDANTLSDSTLLGQLRVQPNSQDWDKLLAAVKYAVNRLELPDAVSDVSDIPFVLDGRPAPSVLLNFPSNNVQHPSNRRKANARVGSITLARLYQETINVLQAAIANKYMLKGIQGTSGTNTTFDSNVAVHQHAAFSANAAGSSFATTVTHGLQFNFSNLDTDLQRFFYAGQAIELLVRTQPSASPTTADTNLSNLCSQFGRFRITQDAVYVMNNSVTPGLSQVPGSIGVGSLTTVSQTLATATVGGATLTLRAQLVNDLGSEHPRIIRVYIDILAGGATTGTVFTTWNVITDDELYAGSTRVFPTPLAYTASDELGNAAGLSLFS